MAAPDSAVGAILEIPKEALEKINAAERAIQHLAKTSFNAASAVRTHWSNIAPQGLDTFIQKLADANEAMRNMGTMELNIKTQQSQTELDNLSKKTKDTTTEVSESVQKLSTTPVSLSGIRDEVEATSATFRDVAQHIKSLKNSLLSASIVGDATPAQQQGVALWEQYYKSISKVNEETNRHERNVNELKAKIKETEQSINTEREAVERLSQKIREAWDAVNAFKNANPDFKVDKAEQQLESLKEKIRSLYAEVGGGGLSEKQEKSIFREIEDIKRQYAELDNMVITARRVYSDLATAEDNYSNRLTRSDVLVGEKTAKLRELNSSLQKAEQSQAAYNKELEKGNTAKSLTAEYVQLTKRIQELNAAMNKFEASGGNINSAAYKALESEMTSAMARRKEIEKADIAEVNQYRQQMASQAYQADLSAFVQTEAQKRAEAQKTLDEQVAKAKLAGQQYAQSFQGAMTQFNKLMDDNNNSNKFVVNLENVKRVLNDLKAASGKLNLFDPADVVKSKKLQEAITQLTRLYNQYKSATDAKPTIADAQQLTNVARATRSLQSYKDALDAIKRVMETMDSKDPMFKKMSADAQEMKKRIDEIKKSMGEFQNQTRKTGDTFA